MYSVKKSKQNGSDGRARVRRCWPPQDRDPAPHSKTATWPRWEPAEAASSLTSRCLNVAILQGGSRLQVEGCSPSCHSQITATTHASFITRRSHARCIAVSRFLIYNWQKYEFNFFFISKGKRIRIQPSTLASVLLSIHCSCRDILTSIQRIYSLASLMASRCV